ncbi:Holliday junction resolvase RuvX [Portibacter marinus]|uniref:Holliday junction resolvase RuvX n=1 Tax=Portibacter marinus TaxID=2898660 RepID=UPI001F02DBC1|nr:Holliday junction resolvase RuvX [Portibacter marinus]
MARILAIDYGAKRCGLAVTDYLKISINPLKVLEPEKLVEFLQDYVKKENVDTLIIGWPTHADGKETYLVKEIKKFLSTFAQLFPNIKIEKVDESFSSSEAKQLIWDSGVRKKKRMEKSLVDQVSAILLIKRYLDSL